MHTACMLFIEEEQVQSTIEKFEKNRLKLADINYRHETSVRHYHYSELRLNPNSPCWHNITTNIKMKQGFNIYNYHR